MSRLVVTSRGRLIKLEPSSGVYLVITGVYNKEYLFDAEFIESYRMVQFY